MRNLKIVTPEGVTGYPTSEPCGCPIRPSSFINRTETVTASVGLHESRHLPDVGRMVDFIRCIGNVQTLR